MARRPRRSSPKSSKKRAYAIAAAVAALLLPLLVHACSSKDEPEALRTWVEQQNLIFLVPAQGELLPGDIVRWPAAQGGVRRGSLMTYARSAEILDDPDSAFRRTGPSQVVLTDTIQSGLRAGALSASLGTKAQAKGIEDFQLILHDVELLDAPLTTLRDAVAARPDLVQALRDPNTTIVTRILRPRRFEYRFSRGVESGFSASLKRLLGLAGTDPIVESGGSTQFGMTVKANAPMVIGIEVAGKEILDGNGSPRAVIRKLDNSEARALQPDANAALWPAGSTLRVGFLDGGAAQKSLFQDALGEWLRFANLKVRYVPAGEADIRVQFGRHPGLNYSYVGRNALQVRDGPTIVLGRPVDSPGARGQYLHEIGHALGLVHELQNPAAQPHYDRQAVYAVAAAMGWPRSMVESSFFNTNAYPGARDVDRNSIMSYALPASIFNDGPGFAPGDDLSPSDRAYIAQLYPRAG